MFVTYQANPKSPNPRQMLGAGSALRHGCDGASHGQWPSPGHHGPTHMLHIIIMSWKNKALPWIRTKDYPLRKALLYQQATSDFDVSISRDTIE